MIKFISFSMLFCFFSLKALSQTPYFILEGTVSDVESGLAIDQATITLKRSDGKSFEVITDYNGQFFFDSTVMMHNYDYELFVTASGYFNASAVETTKNFNQPTKFIHDFKLQKSTCSHVFNKNLFDVKTENYPTITDHCTQHGFDHSDNTTEQFCKF